MQRDLSMEHTRPLADDLRSAPLAPQVLNEYAEGSCDFVVSAGVHAAYGMVVA
jgi:hypothetical protein